MAIRNYTSAAPPTTLAAGISNVDATLAVASSSGFPTAPFVAIIDRDNPGEEAVLVTNVAGPTWTVTRGYDSTIAISHMAGVTVEHGVTAIEFREANAHVNATSDVHGVSGGLKSYIDTQDAIHPAATTNVHGVTGSLKGYIDTADSTHAALTSGVHGVTGSIQSRLTATEGVANTATSDLATHIANGTGVHGVTGSLKTYIDSGSPGYWARISHAAAQTITVGQGAAGQIVDLQTAGWDPYNMYTAGDPNKLLPARSTGPLGIYTVHGSVQFSPSQTSGWRALVLYLKGNGGTTDYIVGQASTAGNTTTVGGPVILNVSGVHIIANANDYFYMKAFHDAGVSTTLVANQSMLSVGFIGKN